MRRSMPFYVEFADECSSDEEDDSHPVLFQQPRNRFGIFCTAKPGQRRMGGMRR